MGVRTLDASAAAMRSRDCAKRCALAARKPRCCVMYDTWGGKRGIEMHLFDSGGEKGLVCLDMTSPESASVVKARLIRV